LEIARWFKMDFQDDGSDLGEGIDGTFPSRIKGQEENHIGGGSET